MASDHSLRMSRSIRTALNSLITAAENGTLQSTDVESLKSAICDSEPSEDNVKATERIEFGLSRSGTFPSIGLTVGKSRYLVSNLLWHLEGEPVPASIREIYPRIAQKDWDAALRMAVLILGAFSVYNPGPKSA